MAALEPLRGVGSTSLRREYKYDYISRWLEKKVFTWGDADQDGTLEWDVTTDRKFVYDGWNVIMELEADVDHDGTVDNTVVRKYAWGLDLAGQNGSANSLQGAGGISGLLAMEDDDPATTWEGGFLYFYDGNGNVGQVVDADSGTIAVKYEYDPYGGRINAPAEGEFDQPFRFSTKYFDSETGFYSYIFRLYGPRLGRWLSHDPLAEKADRNLYRFDRGNPTGMVDAIGLKTYVVEGTWAGTGNELGPCNAEWFGLSDPEGQFILPGLPAEGFWNGTVFAGACGSGTQERGERLAREICTDMCSESPPSRVDIVGWSRGAVSALIAVDILAREGCCCRWKTEKVRTGFVDVIGMPGGGVPTFTEKKTCCDQRFPKISFLGLYDPVDRRPCGYPDEIPPIVQVVGLALASQTDIADSWCNWLFLKPHENAHLYAPARCKPKDPTKTQMFVGYIAGTHGDIGCGALADRWMRNCARSKTGSLVPAIGPQHTPKPKPEAPDCSSCAGQ